MVALALHLHDRVRSICRVLHDFAPALECRLEECLQGLPVVLIAQRRLGREQHLRISQRNLREDASFERDDLRRRTDVVGQPQRLHHVISLHGIDLAGQQALQLQATRQDADVRGRQDPAHQLLGVHVHPDAQDLSGAGTVAQPRSRQGGQAQGRSAEHRSHGLDPTAAVDRRQQRVLLHGAHEQGLPTLLLVAPAHRGGLRPGSALRQQAQVDARPRVEAAAHGHGDARELRRHVVVQLKSHTTRAS
mmetsp:Transcript_67947/g.176215  ORF Transcript_67947/g.176215 Transcript_67947/m.176215 type:complete len:248 (+) Transcript_67947:619-1362(+)